MPAHKPDAEEISLVRRLAGDGWTWIEIAHVTRFNARTLANLARDHNIERGPRLGSPAKTTAEIRALVDQARRKFVPVFCPDTLAKPHKCPLPYTPSTLFVVGGLEHVTVDRLRELAA